MGWDNRLRVQNFTDAISSLFEAPDEPKTEKPTVTIAKPEIVDQKPEIKPFEIVVIESNVLPVIPKTNKKKGGSNNGMQIDMFDFTVDH